MLFLQLLLFCALITLMVKAAVGSNARNGLYLFAEVFLAENRQSVPASFESKKEMQRDSGGFQCGK